MHSRLDFVQDDLHLGIRATEGLHVERGHGRSVGPKYAILNLIQSQRVATNVVTHGREEFVASIGGGGDTPLHMGMDNQSVVNVDEKCHLQGELEGGRILF